MASPFDKIVDMIKKLDLNDDGIIMNHKIRSIEQDFCNIVVDEDMLSKSMEYINQQVLCDSDASLKFALLFASRTFDSLAMNDVKVRFIMLSILQENFHNAEEYRKQDKRILYNSITLLGEYYHRIRLANGNPITVLGESLLEQLTRELNFETDSVVKPIDFKLAKLILSQITLNGSLLRVKHKEGLDTLLFIIRRNLIEIPNINENVKALLLMTLDLYYNDFTSLGENLESMYTKYLIEEDISSEKNLLTKEPNSGDQTEETTEQNPVTMKFKWSEEVSDNFVDNLLIENYDCNSPQTAADLPSPLNIEQDRLSPPIKTSNSNSNLNSGYEDDRHSVRSEGGSIRLYNVSDRLKHAQRGNHGNGNSNGSNWERNYNSYDPNRRSSSRNSNSQYENNRNYQNKNNRNYNNTYNRPPRFSNNEFWRTGNDYGGSRQNLQNPNSRSSSQNRERYSRPHQSRNNYDNYNGRSVSPTSSKPFINMKNKDNFNRHNGLNGNQQNQQQHPQQSRSFIPNRNNRYGSQNSLTSDTGTWERRGRRQNNRGKSQKYYLHDDTRSLHDHNQNEDEWNAPSDNSELVKNARNTTDYMKFLSKK